MTICFDMDGTISALYDVPNWLPMLRSCDPTPYMVAKPMVNLSTLARQLNAAKRHGAKLVIVSWSSKGGNDSFDAMVAEAKRNWLAEHLPSVEWDEIIVSPYGRNKAQLCGVDEGDSFFLFDDEARNREDWEDYGGLAFKPDAINEVLSKINHCGW